MAVDASSVFVRANTLGRSNTVVMGVIKGERDGRPTQRRPRRLTQTNELLRLQMPPKCPLISPERSGETQSRGKMGVTLKVSANGEVNTAVVSKGMC